MWAVYTQHDLPAPWQPHTWLARVLPRPRETFIHHLRQVQKRITEGAFDPKVSFFAADERGPAGLILLSGEQEKRRLDLIGVRGDRRCRKLGGELLARAIRALRGHPVEALTASSVSSANIPAVRLLESAGFAGNPTGSIRMRRALDGPLPPYSEPRDIAIRAFEPGEEPAWVALKNACFAGSGEREWTVDDFHREFTQSPIFDPSRLFVALEDGQMVGTATAWEADYGEGSVGLIHWVCTHPERRSRGVGSAVNLRALEELAALGYADAWLNTTRRREPAVRLYERLGFHIHREQINYTLNL